MEEQKLENDHLTKRLKLEIQHAFNENVKVVVNKPTAILDKNPATGLERVKDTLKEGMQLIDEHQEIAAVSLEVTNPVVVEGQCKQISLISKAGRKVLKLTANLENHGNSTKQTIVAVLIENTMVILETW